MFYFLYSRRRLGKRRNQLDACAAHGTTRARGAEGKASDCSILHSIKADCGGLHLFTAYYSTLHLERDPL
jgi:hypothetical protein